VEPEPKANPAKAKTRRPPKSKSAQTSTNNSSGEAAKVKESTDTETKTEPTETVTQPKHEVVVTDTTAKTEPRVKKEPAAAKPNPLANVRLVILFKDGAKVERPMTEVFRFTADQSTLTVIGTNGRVAKYPILDVVSVTIQ